MKKLLFALTILFAFALTTQAQIRWPFGSVNSVDGSTYTNDTIDISGNLVRGFNYITSLADTNLVLNVTTLNSSWVKGDLLVIDFTNAETSADTIRYGTNITGTYTAVPSGKSTMITFFYTGTIWKKLSSVQID